MLPHLGPILGDVLPSTPNFSDHQPLRPCPLPAGEGSPPLSCCILFVDTPYPHTCLMCARNIPQHSAPLSLLPAQGRAEVRARWPDHPSATGTRPAATCVTLPRVSLKLGAPAGANRKVQGEGGTGHPSPPPRQPNTDRFSPTWGGRFFLVGPPSGQDTAKQLGVPRLKRYWATHRGGRPIPRGKATSSRGWGGECGRPGG